MIAPGAHLAADKMPGHWLLARLGKRVLRPGGRELTLWLLDTLNPGPDDDVVEFAPGMGATAQLTLQRSPRSFVGVDRESTALRDMGVNLVLGKAEETGLAPESSSLVYGEAMLSMQTAKTKEKIVAEARRILRQGGRYGIHELCLVPDTLPVEQRELIAADLSGSIHVGARPLTVTEWTELLEGQGFEIEEIRTTGMRLLEPGRFLRDEGLWRTLRFLWNLLWNPAARRRVFEMARTFRRYRDHLAAIAIVARAKG